ncbi:dihydroorotate dehydrogenase electron transfer subunit [bacterium]|nr:dihydroorotate dehydrogenase electron transfer subunit [bacterium]
MPESPVRNWTIARVARHALLRGANRLLEMEAPDIARIARPGQFVEVSTKGATLLNKPFSIAGVNRPAGTISIAYKVIGRGTTAIAQYRRGAAVRLLGPCGNGFERPEGRVYLAGGGIGIPPLHFCAAEWAGAAEMTAIFGARSSEDLVLVEETARALGRPVVTATDDGSEGRKGSVCDALAAELDAVPGAVIACGPSAMLRAVALMCAERAVPAWLCLEAYMACGAGICMGCVVPTVRGMERVCREGPVFDARDIRWDAFGG